MSQMPASRMSCLAYINLPIWENILINYPLLLFTILKGRIFYGEKRILNIIFIAIILLLFNRKER